ncbi:TetR/AcrR family transcriptional regulator [Paenibacillus sp. L3-i20]|uniref:TetR/AcrR family transcriptional regulator n=1 Tax=Paenibacillus sp. L3-i20 TaxID=2905833 RepID=UPI001EDEA016|nr:TetR/AcrR family transcriptional regulator [Paenibacillus sp. L3-i20]GKU80098.1 TetR family transcriptional regulator [Paenibacillus sp. L3-i20]
MKRKLKRPEDVETTKQLLLRRAEQRFAEIGYAKTSIDEIVKQEQLTKGAMYYHFKDKRDLFEQVVDRLLQEIVDRILNAIDGQDDPWEKTMIAIDTYLEGCLQLAYRRIVIQEAPAILGWKEWREKEKRSVMKLSTMLLMELMASSYIKEQSVELLNDILFGAITEAAIGIAHSNDPSEARIQAKSILERMLKAMT